MLRRICLPPSVCASFSKQCHAPHGRNTRGNICNILLAEFRRKTATAEPQTNGFLFEVGSRRPTSVSSCRLLPPPASSPLLSTRRAANCFLAPAAASPSAKEQRASIQNLKDTNKRRRDGYRQQRPQPKIGQNENNKILEKKRFLTCTQTVQAANNSGWS